MTYPTSFFPSITLDEIFSNCIETSNGCLEWQGRRQKNYASISHKGKNIAVHRIACYLAYGEPFDKAVVLHSCDNPPCVNPKHLRWGTQFDNVQDAKQRKRRAFFRGERNGRSKLDENKVIAIRAMAKTGLTNCEIAEVYGISNQMVSRIIKSEAWAHIK